MTPRVLIIDDDADYCAILGRRLSGIFDICFETSVERGISQMEQREPDAVLLDLSLPDSSPNPKDTLSRIKRYRHHAAIVILSGNADPVVIYDMIQGNAAGFIVKGRDDDSDKMAHEVNKAIAAQQFSNIVTPAIKKEQQP